MGLKAKKLLFKTIITLLMLTVSTMVSAGSVWDGSVSIARYGYLPHTGMYAASNAFPQNSRVTVTNPGTGKSVNVIVLERLEDNNLFLVLSAEAAESIGISYGDIFHGSISKQVTTGPGAEEDIPYNTDPDVNPSALSGGYSELALIQEYIDNELGGVDEGLIIPDTEVEPEVPEITISDDSVSDSSVPELVEGVEVVEDEPDIPLVENMPLEEVYISEPDVFLPAPDRVEIEVEPVSEFGTDDIPEVVGMNASVPLVVADTADIRENVPELPVQETDIPVVTSMSIKDFEETDNEIFISELPELPIIGVEEVLSDEKPIAVSMTDDVMLIEEAEEISHILPEVISIEEKSDLPDTEPDIEAPLEELVVSDELLVEVEVVLEPSDLRPPVVDIVDETVVEEVSSVSELVEDKPDRYNLTRELVKDSYYLQLGVYREQYSALDFAGRLGGIYPVTVYISDSTDTLNYKVMVGPLGQDESGAVLYSFRSSGYPDAFLRKGL